MLEDIKEWLRFSPKCTKERLWKIIEEKNGMITDLRIKKSNKYKVIYNPNGEDKWFINGNNTVYIQGKPRNRGLFRCDEVINLDEVNTDFEWYEKCIAPLIFKGDK